MSEYLGEDTAATHEARIEALNKTLENVDLQSKISATMQESDKTILGHRFYHEAPNDVFELIVLQLSNINRFGWGKGGLNALRLVSKRCLQVVESVATRLTHLGNPDSLPLAAMKRCKRIDHIRCSNLNSLEGCPDGLKSIAIMGGCLYKSLEPLSACKELQTLEISNATEVSDLSPLSSCTRLQRLILPCANFCDLTPLLSMPSLEELHFFRSTKWNDTSIADLSPLSLCKKLKKLNIGGNWDLQDLSPLCQCPDLEELKIALLELVSDLSFFEKGFARLRVLDINQMQLDDLSPLTRLQHLEELICWGIPNTTSLLPLAKCYTLKKLHCSLNQKDIDELWEKRPDLKPKCDEDEDEDKEEEEEEEVEEQDDHLEVE